MVGGLTSFNIWFLTSCTSYLSHHERLFYPLTTTTHVKSSYRFMGITWWIDMISHIAIAISCLFDIMSKFPHHSFMRVLYPCTLLFTSLSQNIVNFDMSCLKGTVIYWWWADWFLHVILHSTPKSVHDVGIRPWCQKAMIWQ